MKNSVDRFKKAKWLLLLTFVFYFSGVVFIPASDMDDIRWVITYTEMYESPIILFIVLLCIVEIKNDYDIFIIGNGIIGIFLVYMTSKETVVATICYWAALIALYLVVKIDTKERQSADKINFNKNG